MIAIDMVSPNRTAISVMVVDDDPDIREAFSEALADDGLTVETASDGAQALERLRSVAPGLILLDLSMPVMNGKEFREQQLKEPAYASIPTVIISAADRVEEKMNSTGLAGVLEKPVRLSTLLDTVHRLIDARNGTAQRS